MVALATSKALLEQRAALAEKAKDHLATCQEKEGGWSAEDKQAHQRMMDEIRDLGDRAKAIAELETIEAPAPEQRAVDPKPAEQRAPQRSAEEHRQAIRDFFATQPIERTPEQRERMQRYGINPSGVSIDLDRGFRGSIPNRAAELRVNVKATDTSGGHTVPSEILAPIERAMLDFGGMYQAAQRIATPTGVTYEYPTVNDTANKAAIVPNETTAVTSADMTFGSIPIPIYTYATMVLVSNTLLQDTSAPLAQIIGEEAGKRFGRGANEHFTDGTGPAQNQPYGITVATHGAADSGITQATLGTLTYANMLDLQHSVDPAYRRDPSCAYMGNDAILGDIKGITDSQGRPLWLPSLDAATPSLINGYPFIVNQDMASTGGAKGLLFGAMSYYKIVEAQQITLRRLEERYAEYNQTAFLMFYRAGGRLVRTGTEAVKYLTLGS